MKLQYLLLCIFPVIVTVLILIKCKLVRREDCDKEFLSMDNTKILRGSAALGIVTHHLTQLATNYGEISGGPIGIFNYAGILFTGIFFFCSGYGLYISYRNKEDYLKGFFRKRLPGILIPYFVANIVYYLVNVIVYERRYGSIDTLTSLTGITLVNPNSWFIVELILLYVIFYFAFRKCKTEKKAVTMVFIASVVMIAVSLLLGHDTTRIRGHWFQGEWWYNSTILFSVGILIAKYREKFLERAGKRYVANLVTTVMVFAAAMVLDYLFIKYVGYYAETDYSMGYFEKFTTLLVQTVAVISFVYIVLLINMRVKFGNRPLKFISKISFEIYLMHGMIVYLFENSFINKTMPYALIYFIVFVLSILAGFLFNLLFTLLIRLWNSRKEFYENVPETYEGKVRWNMKMKRLKRLRIIFIVSVIVLLGLCVKELIDRYYLPYKEFKEEAAVLETAQIGDTVEYGEYDVDWQTEGNEKIPWTVTDKKDDKVLLVSQYALFAGAFDSEFSTTRWEDSSLRGELFLRFFMQCFSKYERSQIAVTDNEGAQDRIFILSKSEVDKYYKTDKDRQLKPSPMAEKRSTYKHWVTGNTWWWLRDSGETRKKIKTIFATGEFSEDWASITSGGIRPAMWVSIN
ncbi:MAG: acyltransferase family protein [Butyrivibrio sp.]|nr:acyltransferase family protein [Butyrivibrio sp.]